MFKSINNKISGFREIAVTGMVSCGPQALTCGPQATVAENGFQS